MTLITLKLQYQSLVVLTGKASPSIYSMVMATSRSQTFTVSHWGRVWVNRVCMVTTISSVSCQNHKDLQYSVQELKNWIDDSLTNIIEFVYNGINKIMQEDFSIMIEMISEHVFLPVQISLWIESLVVFYILETWPRLHPEKTIWCHHLNLTD